MKEMHGLSADQETILLLSAQAEKWLTRAGTEDRVDRSHDRDGHETETTGR
jgi:hypothetical protein